MDLKNVETAFEFLKENNSVNTNHLEELFLIGRLTDNETILEEISAIFKTTDKTIQAVWNSKIKISNLGNYKDNDARLKNLISIAKKTSLLEVGKMWQLLQSDLEFIYNENDEELKEKYEFSLEIGIYKSSPFVKDPALISKFNGIKKIRISDAFHTALPNEIGDLTLLEELEIVESKINVLPDTFKNLESLKKMDLQMPELAEIPEFIKDLPALQTLAIEGARYSYVQTKFKIPSWIGEMKQLKSLRLVYLSEEHFPENLFPSQLETINFAQLTNLKSLPPITQCKNLKKFKIATSPFIQELPEGMAQLTTLENLELINMEGLKKLDGNLIYAPNINNLKISGVDASISEPERKINNAIELTIRNENYLKYVLENADLFPNLKELTVTSIKNKIETTGSFGKLNKLVRLKLSDNKEMQQIVDDLGNCTLLEEIEFFNMDLSNFPDLSSITQMKSMRILNGNNLHFLFSSLPQKIDFVEIRNVNLLDFQSPTSKSVQTLTLQNTSILNFNEIGLHDFQAINIFQGDSIDGEVYSEKLPLSISKIENLVSFKFYGNIKHIDDCFSPLLKLETISISGSYYNSENYPIKTINSESFKNQNLKSITLENYTGSNLNELLKNTTNIESLKLKKIDGLDYLPDLTHLKNLKQLTIDHCESFISLGNPLPEIQSVSVDFCKNTSIIIYSELEAIKSLRSVSLTFLGDTFNYFPDKLDFLENLRLNHLKISEIPTTIKKFKNLKTLELDGMSLRQLPKEMAVLSNLRRLAIDSNLLAELPVEFVALQLEQVRMYFSKFAGNNMKREVYAVLINDNCNLVKQFDGDVYYWQTMEARDYRRKHFSN